MKIEKFCQSCGMPFAEIKHGTESNGEESKIYCELCYSQGEFIEPDITFDQMLERGIKGLEEKEGSNFKKKIMIKYYPKMLKKLDRWNSKNFN